MPRLRRYLPLLLFLLPVIFICGKLLLTMIPTASNQMPMPNERGWPWVFQRYYEPIPGFATFANDNSFSIVILLADVVFLSAIVGMLALLIAWRRKRTGRWFRFSLRELLVLIAVTAIPCAWWAYHIQQQRHELALESRWEGTLRLQPGFDSAPGWMRRLSNTAWTEVFQRVDLAQVIVSRRQDTETAEFPAGLVADLASLPDLRRLMIADGRSDPDETGPFPLRPSSAELRLLDRIEVLMIEGPVDDETLRRLAELPRLQTLWLDDAMITIAGTDALLKFPALRKLTIQGLDTTYTDEQILRLAEIPCLQSLALEITFSPISRDLPRRIRNKKPHLELLGFPLESNFQQSATP
jgi:hypothetical protein